MIRRWILRCNDLRQLQSRGKHSGTLKGDLPKVSALQAPSHQIRCRRAVGSKPAVSAAPGKDCGAKQQMLQSETSSVGSSYNSKNYRAIYSVERLT